MVSHSAPWHLTNLGPKPARAREKPAARCSSSHEQTLSSSDQTAHTTESTLQLPLLTSQLYPPVCIPGKPLAGALPLTPNPLVQSYSYLLRLELPKMYSNTSPIGHWQQKNKMTIHQINILSYVIICFQN